MERRSMKTIGCGVAVLALALGLASCTPESEEQAEVLAAHRSGEVLVKFKNSITTQQASSTLSAAGLQPTRHFASIGVHVCSITNGDGIEAAVQKCESNADIEYAEPNYVYQASEIPNDPRFEELWGLQNANDADIDAVEAWDTQTGSSSVLVAIIDTGVDYGHPDLGTNMWRNPGESGEGRENNGVDDDGNGFVDDLFGWDFAGDDSDPADDNGHGSHVAGTIAAAGNNAVGVVGVNWQASIMALKFLTANGSGTASDAIAAILYAADNGARVMNNSWGGGGFSQALQDAIEFARDRNALFVAAAGNEARDNDATPSYPANYEVDNVVSVAASDRNDRLASFSNFGRTTVDLAAPGADILSTTPNNGYQSFSGTSMATPHVSGVAALVLAQNPELTAQQLAVHVVGSADPVAEFTNSTWSGGRLNAQAALSDAPKVAFVTRWNDTADAAGPYEVTARAADDGAITAVALSYTVNGGDATVVSMPEASAGVYRASIPGQALNATIAYFVDVTDDADNKVTSRTYTFQITEDGGEQPPDCGNFAVTFAPWTGTGGGLIALLLNALAMGVIILAARRLAFALASGRKG